MTKFAFFGTPYVARDTLAALVDAGYIPTVVITSPDAARGRGMELGSCETKTWALEHGLPVLTPETLDTGFVEELASYGCELGIAVAYGKIMPQAVLDVFPRGIVNVHYSLLPAYRGASPVEAALWNGEIVTGVSIQQMARRLDAGDILAQREVPIDANDTTLTLRPKLNQLGADLLIEIFPNIIDGSVVAMPQDELQATYAPKIQKDEGKLDLSADATTNWNTYRALRESPGTYFFAQKDDKTIRVKITDATYANGEFRILKIVPEGKSEQDFSWLVQAGWTPSAD